MTSRMLPLVVQHGVIQENFAPFSASVNPADILAEHRWLLLANSSIWSETCIKRRIFELS